jgi:chemotaxis protein MotA
MFVIVGYVLIMVFAVGGFVMAGGEVHSIWHPLEIVIILGAAIGGFVCAYGGAPLKSFMKALPKLFKPSPYNKAFYMELFACLYEILAKVRKEGLMSIEGDVEDPHQSAIFKKYDKVVHDHHVVEFITDYLRLMVGGNLNAFEIENLMDVEIETHHHAEEVPATMMAKLADGLPAFGIVAAVMGVVKTMGSVGAPPAVLGQMIGAALTGTFYGILMSYGFVAPLASILENHANDGTRVFQAIKVTLLASLNGYAPQVAVEFGRKAMAPADRPSFKELEDHVKSAAKK